jgi:hypothetical protein
LSGLRVRHPADLLQRSPYSGASFRSRLNHRRTDVRDKPSANDINTRSAPLADHHDIAGFPVLGFGTPACSPPPELQVSGPSAFAIAAFSLQGPQVPLREKFRTSTETPPCPVSQCCKARHRAGAAASPVSPRGYRLSEILSSEGDAWWPAARPSRSTAALRTTRGRPDLSRGPGAELCEPERPELRCTGRSLCSGSQPRPYKDIDNMRIPEPEGPGHHNQAVEFHRAPSAFMKQVAARHRTSSHVIAITRPFRWA